MAQQRAVATRDDDERVLAMLRERDRGLTAVEIGAAFGTSGSAVRMAFHRVDHDLAASERQLGGARWSGLV